MILNSELIVTHAGDRNGEVIEVEESIVFTMAAMVINVIDIIPGFVGQIMIGPRDVDPNYAEVEAILQMMFDAGYEVGASLYKVGTLEVYVFRAPDESFSIDRSQTTTFTNYTTAESNYVVSGTSNVISFMQTESSMDIVSSSSLTVEGALVASIFVNVTISATMDFSTGQIIESLSNVRDRRKPPRPPGNGPVVHGALAQPISDPSGVRRKPATHTSVRPGP